MFDTSVLHSAGDQGVRALISRQVRNTASDWSTDNRLYLLDLTHIIRVVTDHEPHGSDRFSDQQKGKNIVFCMKSSLWMHYNLLNLFIYLYE